MKNITSQMHKKESSKNISYGVITLSDSRSYNEDYSGKYIEDELSSIYNFKERVIIPDKKEKLIENIEQMINKQIDVIFTTGGTGLDSSDITVETVENLFNKKIEGFGEIFRQVSYQEIGASALISRATAGVYKKTVIFSMPGSLNSVKTGVRIIKDEIPHITHHAKK